jgi:hypothetical protein
MFFTFLILFSIYSKVESVKNLTPTEIIAWTLIFVFTVGIFMFLFFNHLQFARHTRLIIADQTFKICQGDYSFSASFENIEEIIEYSSKKLPWGFIMKWKIKVGDSEFIVSSLTISQLNFESYFYKKIKHKVSLLPII